MLIQLIFERPQPPWEDRRIRGVVSWENLETLRSLRNNFLHF